MPEMAHCTSEQRGYGLEASELSRFRRRLRSDWRMYQELKTNPLTDAISQGLSRAEVAGD